MQTNCSTETKIESINIVDFMVKIGGELWSYNDGNVMHHEK